MLVVKSMIVFNTNIIAVGSIHRQPIFNLSLSEIVILVLYNLKIIIYLILCLNHYNIILF